jgi:metallo-beta-lactamase class B
MSAGLAAGADNWNLPVEPFRIVGPVHYVGTNELGAYLVTTPAGHILIDGGLPESAPLIEASIRKLKAEPQEIRVLLTTQAHFDHVGSLAHLARLSGGKVEVMDGDVPVIESGGAKDYLFGSAGPRYRFDPVKVARTLHDGDTVELGGVTLTARRTPGHTPGSTTWLTTVKDGARSYRVVFAGSTSINPGTRLVGPSPSYPGIKEDFEHAFEVLESLSPDVFLAAHTGFFGMEQKRARLGQGGENPFVDPAAYRAHVAEKKKSFEDEVARQRR